MTDIDLIKQALEYLEDNQHHIADNERHAYVMLYNDVITTLKERLAQPEQEPVAWGVFEGNLHDMFFTQEEAQEMASLKGSHAEVRPLYTTPPQRTEEKNT
jgi:aspartyl/asparaginyl-tRNA synthetase